MVFDVKLYIDISIFVYRWKNIQILQRMNLNSIETQYGPKEYSLLDNQLALPYNVRQKLKIYRNFINLQQENRQQHIPPQPPLKKQTQQLPIPFQMSQTFIKYMLQYRIITYLSLISIAISFVDIYKITQKNHDILLYINNCISIGLWLSLILKIKQYWEHQKSKKVIAKEYWDLWHVIDLFISIPHPTVWTESVNYYLNLLILFRIILPIKYCIYSSIYCDVRAYRIIATYGLNSNQHFFFAVKALVANLNVFKVLFTEFISLLYFTHGLYLVSAAGEIQMEFMDCFEVIIVSVPTVGFGEYKMPFLGQKILIFLVVIIGAVFNSFITLTMLSQLDMSQQQQSSYWLMQKVQTRQNIQNISKQFIQNSILSLQKHRNKQSNSQLYQQRVHYIFRNEYKVKKSLYNSISYTDINNLFTYFRESLIQFKVLAVQVDNMVEILIRALHNERNRVRNRIIKPIVKNKHISGIKIEERDDQSEM